MCCIKRKTKHKTTLTCVSSIRRFLYKFLISIPVEENLFEACIWKCLSSLKDSCTNTFFVSLFGFLMNRLIYTPMVPAGNFVNKIQ